MKLLKILNGNDGGGVFQCEKQFIQYWSQKNIEVDAVIVGQGKSFNTYKSIVCRHFVLPEMPLSRNLITPLKEIKNTLIKRRYRSQTSSMIDSLVFDQYDAVIYRRHYFTETAYQISRRLDVATYWHMPLSVSNIFEKMYFRNIVRRHRINVIGNSEYSIRSLFDDSNVYVYPGFDKSRIANKDTDAFFRKKLSIGDSQVVFGIAARIKKRKAQHLVIKSFIKLLSDFNNIHLIIAGDPIDSPYSKYCIELASDYKENIHFVGHIDNISEFYASIDVYINSRLDAEPFGISIAESLGSGVPVIAYKLGGPSEMIVSGHNGWLIRNATVASYYTTLKKALRNKNKWKEMGFNAMESSKRFDAEVNAEKLLGIISCSKKQL